MNKNVNIQSPKVFSILVDVDFVVNDVIERLSMTFTPNGKRRE